MSVAGILSSNLFGVLGQGTSSNTTGSSTSISQFKQQFQQIGQDLNSGNLSMAQSDLATLQQSISSNGSTGSTTSGSNSAASTRYMPYQPVTVQASSFQSGNSHIHHNDPHRGGTTASSAATTQNALLLQQMGQALQSGNIFAAQQAYSSLASQMPTL